MAEIMDAAFDVALVNSCVAFLIGSIWTIGGVVEGGGVEGLVGMETSL